MSTLSYRIKRLREANLSHYIMLIRLTHLKGLKIKTKFAVALDRRETIDFNPMKDFVHAESPMRL